MTRTTLIIAFLLGAICAQAEALKINGFLIYISGGCHFSLSLDGELTGIAMPDGAIKWDSDGNIRSVGGAQIKRDDAGTITSAGGVVIKRDDAGKIIKLGGIEIKRDDAGEITEVCGAKLKRDDAGIITGIGDASTSVKFLFKVAAD